MASDKNDFFIPEAFKNEDGSIKFETSAERWRGKILPRALQVIGICVFSLAMMNAAGAGLAALGAIAGAAAGGYVLARTFWHKVQDKLVTASIRRADDKMKTGPETMYGLSKKNFLSVLQELSQKARLKQVPKISFKDGKGSNSALMPPSADKPGIMNITGETLLMDPEKLLGVMAHELTHVAQADVNVIMHNTGVKYSIFFAAAAALVMGAPLGAALLGTGGILAANVLAGGMQRRHCEFIADRGSVLLTGNQGLSSKFEERKKYSPIVEKLSDAFEAVSTHPKYSRRIKSMTEFYQQHYLADKIRKSPSP